MGNFLEEASDVRGDILKPDLRIVSEAGVSVVPSEVVVIVSVVVAQYLACLWIVVLESVEPIAGVVVVGNGEHLNTTTGDGSVQFQRIAHLL